MYEEQQTKKKSHKSKFWQSANHRCPLTSHCKYLKNISSQDIKYHLIDILFFMYYKYFFLCYRPSCFGFKNGHVSFRLSSEGHAFYGLNLTDNHLLSGLWEICDNSGNYMLKILYYVQFYHLHYNNIIIYNPFILLSL